MAEDLAVIGARAVELSAARKRSSQLFTEIKQAGQSLESAGAMLKQPGYTVRGFEIGIGMLKDVIQRGGLDRLAGDIAECVVLEQRIVALRDDQRKDGVE